MKILDLASEFLHIDNFLSPFVINYSSTTMLAYHVALLKKLRYRQTKKFSKISDSRINYRLLRNIVDLFFFKNATGIFLFFDFFFYKNFCYLF